MRSDGANAPSSSSPRQVGQVVYTQHKGYKMYLSLPIFLKVQMFNRMQDKHEHNVIKMIFESKQKVQTLKIRISCGGKRRYAFLTSGEESSGASDWSDDCSHF